MPATGTFTSTLRRGLSAWMAALPQEVMDPAKTLPRVLPSSATGYCLASEEQVWPEAVPLAVTGLVVTVPKALVTLSEVW